MTHIWAILSSSPADPKNLRLGWNKFLIKCDALIVCTVKPNEKEPKHTHTGSKLNTFYLGHQDSVSRRRNWHCLSAMDIISISINYSNFIKLHWLLLWPVLILLMSIFMNQFDPWITQICESRASQYRGFMARNKDKQIVWII